LQLLEMESIDTFACATMTIVLELTVAILCFMPFSRAHFRRRTAAVLDKQVLIFRRYPGASQRER